MRKKKKVAASSFPIFLPLLFLIILLASFSSSIEVASISSSSSIITTSPPAQITANSAWSFQGQNQQNTWYSPQTIVNSTNVAHLKVLWFAQLGDIAGTPVISKGIVYVTAAGTYTPLRSIFAVNESTGKVLWADGPTKQTGLAFSTVGGVTVDKGSIFAATAQNQLVSLKARTGTLNFEVSVVKGIKGSLTTYIGPQATPLVYKGEVMISDVLGDTGGRGFLRAFNESNGNLIWTFYTVPPSPITSTNQAFYKDTWGTNGTSGCMCGGGALYNLPTLDPKTGIIYFGTGNPGPRSSASVRSPNPVVDTNLYTDSVIALNAKNGHLIWYYQEVPADTRDYDQGMPVQLFNTTINSVQTEVVGAGGKDGYYYELNAANGALVHKISVGIHFSHGKTLYPNSDGGINTFSSYNPTTNMIYTMAYNADFGIPSAPVNSTLYAIDASTGSIVWSRNVSGLGGGASSTNGLVFMSNGAQKFFALDARTGRILWSIRATAGGFFGHLWNFGPPSVTDGMVFETMIGPTGGLLALTTTTT